MKMKVVIETIPHSEQRYDTCGDWWQDGDTMHIRVSKMSDPRYEQLVVVHELVEVFLCQHAGITAEQVDAFDLPWEGEGEPGDDPAAPYVDQHCFATAVERMLCAAMGIKWTDYDSEVMGL